jgi:hypothetical protein
MHALEVLAVERCKHLVIIRPRAAGRTHVADHSVTSVSGGLRWDAAGAWNSTGSMSGATTASSAALANLGNVSVLINTPRCAVQLALEEVIAMGCGKIRLRTGSAAALAGPMRPCSALQRLGHSCMAQSKCALTAAWCLPSTGCSAAAESAVCAHLLSQSSNATCQKVYAPLQPLNIS